MGEGRGGGEVGVEGGGGEMGGTGLGKVGMREREKRAVNSS